MDPVDLETVTDYELAVDSAQVENGEWYNLSAVLDEVAETFDKFGEEYERVDYAIYNIDIMRIFDHNDRQVEDAFAELCAIDAFAGNGDTLQGVIDRTVNYAIETAYRIDLAEFARNFAHELDRAETVE